MDDLEDDPRSLRALVEKYLSWLLAANFSKNTEKGRRSHLSRFVTWAEDRDVTRAVEVSRVLILEYQRHLFLFRKNNGQPLTKAHQSGALSSLAVWFQWLTMQGLALYNPVAGVVRPRIDRTLPHTILTAADVEKILDGIDLSTPFGIRDRAILEVLYSTAIRRGELRNLTLEDIDGARGTLLIRAGKGGRDRVVPIGQRALDWLDRYLAEARPSLLRDPDERTVFLSSRGKAFRLTTLSEMGRSAIKNAGIEGKTLGCHVFRHTTATLMLDRGADIRHIQELLGHQNLTTTQIYTRVSIQKLKDVHAKTHPAERDNEEVQADGDPNATSESQTKKV